MRENSRFEKLNSSPLVLAVLCLGVFLLLLYCNLHTDLVADDYRYCFSFADGSRISAVRQIFPSMAAHRLSMNGRLIPHFLVQLFLMAPKAVFNLFNALMFLLLVWLIARVGGGERTPKALLFAAVFGCIWLMQPDFGQVFLWLDGSVNYLWCAVLCFLWLRPWTARFLSGREPGRGMGLLFCLFSAVLGSCSVNAAVALVFMALLFLLIAALRQKQKPALWQLASLACLLAGWLFLMLAPATAANKAAEMRLPVLLANFAEAALYYLRFWPLLICWLLFFVLSVRQGADPQPRILSLIFLGGSLAGHFVLGFAMYIAARSAYIGLLLLLAADVVLFVPLYEQGREKLLRALCALCLAASLCMVYVGVRDILRTDYLLDFNQELIEACVRSGETEVSVPRPYPNTKYSAMAGLPYLNTEDPGDWPNVYMARYYGAGSIRGY